MLRFFAKGALMCALVACSTSGATPGDLAPDAAEPVDTGTMGLSDSGFLLEAGHDAAPNIDADGAVFPPAAVACEYAFFAKHFDKDNGAAYGALRDDTFQYIVAQVDELQACGAKVTLGGMLSLMIYEGGGAKVALFNDRCSQNSYDTSATCWTNPKARYSYQYGLAPVHTSNFHPCADVAYTSKMRARLATAIADAGFAPSADAVKGVTAELQSFCPGVAPTAVDYYILTAHSAFGIPHDATGNDLTAASKFPFFTPRVVIDLFFAEIGANCAALTDDSAAIKAFGGNDTSYAQATKQQQILSIYQSYATANCGP